MTELVASVALVLILNDSLGLRQSLRKVYQQAADALDGEGPLRRP
jgi:hypothetical protein